MMIKKLLILSLSVFSGLIFANQGDQLQQMQKTLQGNAAQQYQSSVQGIYNAQSINAQSYQTVVQTLSQASTNQVQQSVTQNANESKEASGVLVFVSLGMPEPVLRQILMQANQLGVPVVVRGVLNNNFKDSAKVLFSILHPQNQPAIKGGLTIDPKWFKEFGITQVPAVVAVSDAAPCYQDNCPTPAFDVVYGNIPIPEALKKIVSQGNAAQSVAERYLSKLGGAANAY